MLLPSSNSNQETWSCGCILEAAALPTSEVAHFQWLLTYGHGPQDLPGFRPIEHNGIALPFPSCCIAHPSCQVCSAQRTLGTPPEVASTDVKPKLFKVPERCEIVVPTRAGLLPPWRVAAKVSGGVAVGFFGTTHRTPRQTAKTATQSIERPPLPPSMLQPELLREDSEPNPPPRIPYPSDNVEDEPLPLSPPGIPGPRESSQGSGGGLLPK
jgi:hypothetical protein